MMSDSYGRHRAPDHHYHLSLLQLIVIILIAGFASMGALMMFLSVAL
jgi:hypothetical protein